MKLQETVGVGVQLNKYLAHAGVASRRESVELIKSGRVTVNSHKVIDPGYRVRPGDMVKVGSKRWNVERKVYFLLNKPKDCVSTRSDEKGRRTVMDLLDRRIKERVYPIGRLDRDTTGVILLTNDGDLANKLAHPRNSVAKVYKVLLDKPLSFEDQKKIEKGVRLFDGVVKVDSIYFPQKSRTDLCMLTLHSGKYRVIRRLMEALGYRIEKLDRTNYAFLTTGGVERGQMRIITPEEVEKLYGLVKDEKPIKLKPVIKPVIKK